VQEQANADFLISFTPGNYYFTIRALRSEASLSSTTADAAPIIPERKTARAIKKAIEPQFL